MVSADSGLPVLTGTGGAPGIVVGGNGPPAIVIQHLTDTPAKAQQGGGVIGNYTMPVHGGQVVAFWSASAMSASAGQPLIADLAAGGEPAGQGTCYATAAGQHLALARRRSVAGHLEPDPDAYVALTAGAQTVTTTDDRVSLTTVEMGVPALWDVLAEASGVPRSGTEYGTVPFRSHGGLLLICASATCYSQAAGQVGMTLTLDGAAAVGTVSRYAMGAEPHQAVVPADFLVPLAFPGPHTLTCAPLAGTLIGQEDVWNVTIIEVLGPATVVKVSTVAACAPAAAQPGRGTVASGAFTSSGGTLIVCAAASAFNSGPAAKPLYMSVRVDGTACGDISLLAGSGPAHWCLTGNDVVVADLGPGPHEVALMAGDGTVTDENDRYSITVIEVATTWP